MLSVAPALHQAIFDALDGDAALAAELGTGARIHSGRAPVQSPFPHLTFGMQPAAKWDTHDKDGAESVPSIEVWVREPSWLTANLLREHVDRILGQVDIDLTALGFAGTALSYYEAATYLEDPEENVRHIVLDYRYNILED